MLGRKPLDAIKGSQKGNAGSLFSCLRFRGACLYGERSDVYGLDLRDELADAIGDSDAALVELVLPEHAGEYGAPERPLRSNGCGRCVAERDEKTSGCSASSRTSFVSA